MVGGGEVAVGGGGVEPTDFIGGGAVGGGFGDAPAEGGTAVVGEGERESCLLVGEEGDVEAGGVGGGLGGWGFEVEVVEAEAIGAEGAIVTGLEFDAELVVEGTAGIGGGLIEVDDDLGILVFRDVEVEDAVVGLAGIVTDEDTVFRVGFFAVVVGPEVEGDFALAAEINGDDEGLGGEITAGVTVGIEVDGPLAVVGLVGGDLDAADGVIVAGDDGVDEAGDGAGFEVGGGGEDGGGVEAEDEIVGIGGDIGGAVGAVIVGDPSGAGVAGGVDDGGAGEEGGGVGR